jgi:hypothetical protein
MTHRYPAPDQARSRKEVGSTCVAILDLTDNIVVVEVPKAGIRSRIPMPPMPSTYTVENATHLFYYFLRNEQTMRMLNGWNRLIN